MNYFVHESSYIDDGAQIGDDTKIWHFCHVMSTAKIGKNCSLGQNVLVAADVTIGNNVKIQNNVSLYTGVIVEDNAFLGPSMVFTNVINPRSHVIRKHEYKKTLVKEGASIGANATIICGVTLGRFCFIGAGSVVTKDVPDFALVHGNPAKIQGWYCQCGTRLEITIENNQEIAKCLTCGDQYQKSGLVVTPISSKEIE